MLALFPLEKCSRWRRAGEPRVDGGTERRVEAFLLLELLAAAINAWLLGWFLRLVALFWKQDERVRDARQELELAMKARQSPDIAQGIGEPNEL